MDPTLIDERLELSKLTELVVDSSSEAAAHLLAGVLSGGRLASNRLKWAVEREGLERPVAWRLHAAIEVVDLIASSLPRGMLYRDEVTSMLLLVHAPASEEAKLAGEALICELLGEPSAAERLRAAISEADLSRSLAFEAMTVIEQLESVAAQTHLKTVLAARRVTAMAMPAVSPEVADQPTHGRLLHSPSTRDSDAAFAEPQTPLATWAGHVGGRRFPRPSYNGWCAARAMPADASYPFTMPLQRSAAGANLYDQVAKMQVWAEARDADSNTRLHAERRSAQRSSRCAHGDTVCICIRH